MVTGTWRRIYHDAELQRSSHTLSVINGDAYIFGGELVPRQPRDNKLIKLAVAADGEAFLEEASIKSTATNVSTSPSPRVGSAAATVRGKLYLFSGRGGEAMAPVEEQGALHRYDPQTDTWALIGPQDASLPFPPARSYHCMTSDGATALFVHAGCPESGRLADLWTFDVHTKRWTELPEAPSPARGGTSIAHLGGTLYRMNGFDGKTEQGGTLDMYDIESKTWSTRQFSPDNKTGPEARSVSYLAALKVNSNDKLVTMFGERDPSSLGHAGAGKMLADWWVYDVASGQWEQGENIGADAPVARGWFDADVINQNQIVVSGGLSEENERLNDVWLLSL